MNLNVKMKNREFKINITCKSFHVEGPFIVIINKNNDGGCLIPITEIEIITTEDPLLVITESANPSEENIQVERFSFLNRFRNRLWIKISRLFKDIPFYILVWLILVPVIYWLVEGIKFLWNVSF